MDATINKTQKLLNLSYKNKIIVNARIIELHFSTGNNKF